MLRISTLLTFLFFCSNLSAQMWNGTDSIYGNEWIDYDQSYFKVMVTQDGMHRLSKTALEAAGLPMNSINGSQLQVYYLGEEIPVYVSSDQIFGGNDYLEFYGQKNRGEFDRYLYKDADNEMLNPEYSLVTDTAAYFITWVSNGSPVKRFEEIDIDLNNLPAPEPFYMAHSLANFSDRSVQESYGVGDVYYSSFDKGEGYGTTFKPSHSFNLNTSDVVTSAGSSLVLRMATSKSAHDIDIAFGGDLLENVTPNGYTLFVDTFNISTGALENNNEVTITSNSNDQDKTSVANAWLIYPRAFNFNGENQFIFQVEATSNDKYIEVNNFNAEGQAPVVYDITTGQRIETALEGGVVKFRLEGTNLSGERTLVLSSQVTGYKNASATEVNFVDYTAEDAGFIIISHPKLYNDGNGNNYVAEYANYRSSTQGGSYESIVVDVQQLYDQFGYGLNRHFLSIRNFGHYIKSNWTNPQYVFIIGKGRVYSNVRNNLQINGATTFAVPTFGAPGADNLLMARLDSDVPVIPIGRIAVSDPEDIKTYLDKIQLMESGGGAQTIEDQLWKKNLLHLGGGGNPNEQITIRNHLQSMEVIVEGSKFGGNISGFYKNSSDPIQISESDDIFNRINKGLSVITFFGHSAVGTFDFNIDNPLRYENYGKYPLLLSLGCYSGNIHTSGTGVSERFIFLEDKGAIAFGASTATGYISALATFGKEYYRLMGGEYYGESIGKVMQRTITSFDDNSSFTMGILIQQFTLHGDPSYTVSSSLGPDYVVDTESVSFEPRNINAVLDSFTVKFDIINLGFAISDSMNIIVEQELPNGEKKVLKGDRVITPGYQNSFSYNVPSFKKVAAGQNRLHISVDVNNEVNEFPEPEGEMNNDLVDQSGNPGIPFYIFDDSAKPVYPYQYSIVSDPETVLKASTSDGLAPERDYVFQIDTTKLFSSSLLEQFKIKTKGGVIKWNPSIEFQDSTVYYWRVSPDSISPEAPYVWENSSFVFLENENSRGWNQSHYYQYLENESNSIRVNEERKFQFPEKTTTFRLKNKYYEAANRPEGTINNSLWSDFFRWNILESLTVVVFSNEGENDLFENKYSHMWFNFNPGEYGSVNSNAPRIASFPFPTGTVEQRENIINFLENIIPDSAYVVVYTAIRNPDYNLSVDEWAQDSIILGGNNLFNLLESYGATQVRSMELEGALPYIFAFKKSGSPIYEQLAEDANTTIIFELPIPAVGERGEFQSGIIGPARSWDKLWWQYSEAEIPDTARVSVFGVTNIGFQDSLFTTDVVGEVDLSEISTESYPYLKLKFYAKDEENFTSVQLDRWSVIYEALPDAAVASSTLFEFYSDTIQRGEQGILEMALENISEYDMDSLLIKYSIVDVSNNEKNTFNRIFPLSSNETGVTKFEFDTKNLRGFNRMVLEINPNRDQPEQFQFNNFAIKDFFVETDNKNPLLDVTFDGIHILDGDIVSPKPTINISLNDENNFLSLSDTSIFKVFLKYPGAIVPENIPIEHEWITFFPDVEGDNNIEATIEFKPQLTVDGVYELIIQAEDASGNQSGDLDYKVNFEVITASSLSNILNYPNPFSTSTQFVYTLTGEEVPEYFKIQIFTVSGRIVKEITQDEIGPLKVGTHRTDYTWDGTDEFGDRLANGVYLYRVVTRKQDGSFYDRYETSTDSLFKKGFGKLVIMR